MNLPIDQINARNAQVETDKAWENSLTRRICISILIYLCAVLFLVLIKAENPYLVALVPAGGFLLSGLTIQPIKQLWIKYSNN